MASLMRRAVKVLLAAAWLLVAPGEALAQGALQQMGPAVSGQIPMYVDRSNLLATGGVPSLGQPPANQHNPGTLPPGLALVNPGQALALYSGYSDAPYAQALLGFDGSGNFVLSLDGVAGAPTPGCQVRIAGASSSCIGTVSGLPNVSDNTALRNLAAGAYGFVYRAGYASPGDGGEGFYRWSGTACSLPDNGAQIAPAVGTGCWLRNFASGRLAVGIWGALQDGSNAGPGIRAAAAYAVANGGEVYIPGGAGFTISTSVAAIKSWGACIVATSGLKIVGDRIGGVGSGGASTAASRIYCAADADGIAPVSAARVNNVMLRDVVIEGHAHLGSSTGATAGIRGGFGTGDHVDHVTIKDFSICYVPGNGDEELLALYCSQQDGYPNVANGYPAYGIAYGGTSGQTQGTTAHGGTLTTIQITHGFAATGDGLTTTFPADLATISSSTTEYLLYRTDGFRPTVNGVAQTLGTDYTLTDLTAGTPSATLYGATPSTTVTAGSFGLTVTSATGLPSSITCSGGGAYFGGCAPLIFVRGWGIPVGSYLTSIAGTALTFSNPDGLPARASANEPAIYAQGNVADRDPGCAFVRNDNVTTKITSNCGVKIGVSFTVPPPNGQAVSLLWTDPWGIAGIALKGGAISASNNHFSAINVMGYDVSVEDVSNGQNTFEIPYIQITNNCLDAWSFASSYKFPLSSSKTVTCPGTFGPTTQTNKFTLNTQPGMHNTSAQTSVAMPNPLICADFSVCPLTKWASPSFATAAIANSAVRVTDGWWGVAGAGAAMATSTTTGLFSGSNLSLKWGRVVGNADTSRHMIGQTLPTAKARGLGANWVSLSCWLAAGANFSDTRGVKMQVVGGSGTDEGTASLVAGTWTGQATLLNVNQIPAATATRYNWTVFVPNGTTELAVEASFDPAGTAGAADTAQIAGCQLEPTFLPGPFRFRTPDEEKRLALTQFYQTYVDHTVPGTASTTSGHRQFVYQTTSALIAQGHIDLPVKMQCASPTVSLYSDVSGNATKWNNSNGNADVAMSSSGGSALGFDWAAASVTPDAVGRLLTGHATAECPL